MSADNYKSLLTKSVRRARRIMHLLRIVNAAARLVVRLRTRLEDAQNANYEAFKEAVGAENRRLRRESELLLFASDAIVANSNNSARHLPK